MSARRDNESPGGNHHRAGSNGSMPLPMGIPMPPPPPMPPTNMVGNMPPVVLAPPRMMQQQPPRFAPSDHVSPEVTQPPNPLQHLMYQQQHDAQLFLRNFLSNSQQQPQQQQQQQRGPPASAPIHLMTPIQPAAYHQMQPQPRLVVPPPMAHSMLIPVAPSSAPAASTTTSSFAHTASHGFVDPSTPPPGERITRSHFEYRVGDAEQTELEVAQITIYESQRRSPWGNMIAVNDLFISYPIRNGLIRLLGQSSADRLLLRDHEDHAITDIACFNGRSDLFLSAGTNGKIVIYRILTDPMSHEILKVIHTPVQRVVWHPFDWSRIAIVCEHTVFVTDLHQVGGASAEEEPTDMLRVSVRCSQTTSQINDVVFSPCGRYLVTGGMDGFVHIYQLEGCAVGNSADLLHRFEPFDGGEVWSVRFFSGNPHADGSFASAPPGLLVGGEGNTKLSLWEAPLHDGAQPTCVQSVKFANESNDGEPWSDERVVYDVAFDPSAQFLFVTDRSRPLLFVLHLASGGGGGVRRFNNITEFNVTFPILSGAIVNRATTSDSVSTGGNGGSLTMQLFTVQTHAIQRYNVNADKCYRPYTGGEEANDEDDDENENENDLRHHDAVDDREEQDDEDEDQEHQEMDQENENGSQSVGALTTEEETPNEFTTTSSHQAPAESPRAFAVSPETELDIQTPQQNGDDETEYTSTQPSASLSPRRSFFNGGGVSPHILTHHSTTMPMQHQQQDDARSLAGEDAAGSVRSYARSSPSSSVRAFRDDASLVGELSIDESVISSDQILLYLRRMEANQVQRDERNKEAMQKLMVSFSSQIALQSSLQVEKTIQKQIQNILVPAMGRIVLHTMENNFMKPVQASFERVISDKVVPEMEAKIQASLASTLPDQMDNCVSEMVDRVVEEVRTPVRESFRECFRDIIIPSFQAATQKMFEQIHDHVLKGATATAASGRAESEMAAQLAQLVTLVDGLSRKVDQLQANAGPNAYGNGNHGHVVGDAVVEDVVSAEERQLAAQKSQVVTLLASHDYEEAFKYALGAQNVGLVAFACEQCDARDVLSARPPQLSQMIVLCLVQQLGADLLHALPVKITWLREALLVLNPRDASIVGFVGSVLQELQASLDLVAEEARDSQYTLVHHILKSLLSSV